MAKIEEAIWQGREPPGRFPCLHHSEDLLTRSLFLPRTACSQAGLGAAGSRNSIVRLWGPSLFGKGRVGGGSSGRDAGEGCTFLEELAFRGDRVYSPETRTVLGTGLDRPRLKFWLQHLLL